MHNERGDTLIEVMVSIAVMAVITVGTLAILNRGIGEAQNVSERTSVRAMVSEQVELLNYFRDKYLAISSTGGDTNAYPANIWRDIKLRAASGSSLTDPSTCSAGNQAFNIQSVGSTFELRPYPPGPATADSLPSLNNGLWIDPREFTGSPPQPYIDFSIKTCWKPVVGDVVQNLSTALRLYDK